VPLQVAQAYSRWVQEHGKLYATPAERDYRLTVFYEQWKLVEQSNQEYEQAAAAAGQSLSGPMFAINSMSDLTDEEFKAQYTGALHDDSEVLEEEPVQVATQAVSETQKLTGSNMLAGYSFRIRQQGSCGSCWAFSAVAGLEKFYYDRTGSQMDFSQQELVDCEKESGGCQGGYASSSYVYASKNGLSPASKYPYTGTNGSCKRNSANSVKIGNSFSKIAFSQSKAVSVSGKGIHATVNVYSSGKFRNLSNSNDTLDVKLTGDCKSSTDHFVNIVSASSNTVKIMNSWGTRWGESGFKTIKPCSDSTVWGSSTNIYHP
jgi:C1A family cysteine protease